MDSLGLYFLHKKENLTNMNTPKQACWLIRKIFDGRTWFANSGGMTTLMQTTYYTIKKDYTTLRPSYSQVDRRSVIQVQGILARHQFIVWMALQRKFSTVDRVKKWGIVVHRDCVLCITTNMETFDLMFFSPLIFGLLSCVS